MDASPEHPNVAAVGAAMAALAAGDADPVRSRMTDDFVMLNDVGAGPWRELHGRDAVMDFWARWARWFDGTFHQDVIAALGWDDRVVLFVHETGTAAGEPFDNRAIYLLEIDGDRWTRLRTMDMDQQRCEQFWARVPAPANAPA